MNKKFFITAAIPYVNAKPHIGHALEFVQTDTIARYHKLLGEDCVSLSGGDENALKNVQAAEEAKIPVQEFVDKNTELFRQLAIKLNAEFSIWQKGSDQVHHFQSVQKLWQLCKKDIYKKKYEGLYCVGCEAFYTADELNSEGECYEHPGKKLQKVSEENYFFSLSKYQKELIKLISSDKLKIIPEFRKNEVLSFLKDPLQDISISRTNQRAKNWGVPVPDDPTQRIYVWFDALNIYQSGIGFGWDKANYKKYWPADIHVIGKGITRFHTIYWPAFLLSAKLLLPKSILIHGYLTVNGQKISKTTGNIIDPVPLIEKYGTDVIRYYLLAKVSPFGDGDFSEEKLKEVYNADLANGLGNLVARITQLAQQNLKKGTRPEPIKFPEEYTAAIENFEFNKAIGYVWGKIQALDQRITGSEPYKLVKDNPEAGKKIIFELTQELYLIGRLLNPFLPETSVKVKEAVITNKKPEPLFPRLS